MEELEKGHTLRGELDSTLSAPASLASPPLPSENLATPDSAALPSTSQRRARDASLDKVRGWRMELPEDQRSLREEGRCASCLLMAKCFYWTKLPAIESIRNLPLGRVLNQLQWMPKTMCRSFSNALKRHIFKFKAGLLDQSF